MRGAGTFRHLLLLRELVDRDDLAGAADAGALDDRQPHPAAAVDRDGLPGAQPGAAQCGADPGQDAAADQRRPVEWQIGVDPHDRVLVQQHLLGIAGNADELAKGLPILRQPRRRAVRPR